MVRIKARSPVSAPAFTSRSALITFSSFLVAVLPAQVLLHADGRRQPVVNPRCDSKGRWTAEIEGRRTVVSPGEVAAIIDKDGKETVIIPSLGTTPLTAEAKAMLAILHEPRNPSWREALSTLARQPSRAVVDDLVALANDKKKVLRSRAVEALILLRTRESVLAAAGAILAEKNQSTREQAASLLFSVQEIFKRSDRGEIVKKGVADKDRKVRLVFAMLAPADMQGANAILAKEGLKDRDHHVRESAAVELARRGDRAGESEMVRMLARKKLPGFGKDEELMIKCLIREQVELCELLGKFGTGAANAALEKATSSPHLPVREAANAALKQRTP